MRAEILALEQNQTWDIVDTPADVKSIGCRWVYHIKRQPDDSIERHKARLVAKGYAQIKGMGYLETFSPVVKITTIRVLLALASINNWTLHQLDVHNAYLHGDLLETMYMSLPPGLTPSKPGQCCRLRKSLYGLRQSGRQWYEKLSSFLLSCGYQQTLTDYSLFFKVSGKVFTALLVYVNDIVVTGSSVSEIESVKAALDSKFKVKDLAGLYLCQQKYCLDIIIDAGLTVAKLWSTPMDDSIHLSQNTREPLDDITVY
ncbi:hypothetical protein AAHE18_03G032900 [Arachis hypogaea]